jgi:hypothetical protein
MLAPTFFNVALLSSLPDVRVIRGLTQQRCLSGHGIYDPFTLCQAADVADCRTSRKEDPCLHSEAELVLTPQRN